MMGGWGQGGRAEVSAWRWRAERVQGELGILSSTESDGEACARTHRRCQHPARQRRNRGYPYRQRLVGVRRGCQESPLPARRRRTRKPR